MAFQLCSAVRLIEGKTNAVSPDASGLPPHSKMDVAAILLAAGRSRRMGAFKPLLPFGNRTVIEHCIATLREAGIESVVVVVGHRAEEVRRQLKSFEVVFALNPDPESEMGASIACGIRDLPEGSKAALIALVDHPGVPAEVLTALIDQWEHGAKLAIPEFEGLGGHPALIDLGFREELLRLDPERGLRGFFEEHRSEVQRLPVSSPFVARDMDTWEDYRRLHEEVFGSSSLKG
ncbi:MAG: nucleotidyltransferase family protein [Pyrinomonadaceae bacterium]